MPSSVLKKAHLLFFFHLIDHSGHVPITLHCILREQFYYSLFLDSLIDSHFRQNACSYSDPSLGNFCLQFRGRQIAYRLLSRPESFERCLFGQRVHLGKRSRSRHCFFFMNALFEIFLKKYSNFNNSCLEIPARLFQGIYFRALQQRHQPVIIRENGAMF